jgi:hypothetical protein
MAKVFMTVINKETEEVEDAGEYDSVAEARRDFLNWDKPRGRYAVLGDGTIWR